MFNIKSIVNKITDRGRESNPNSPGRASQEDDGLSLRAEGFLCPKCMKAFASPSVLHAHYESLHADESSAEAAMFPLLRPETSERHRHVQDGTAATDSTIKAEEVSVVTDVAALQRMLLQVLETRQALQTEKDHLEQRAAQLAQLNVTLKAACDEGESNQTALKERLKVVEAQLAHRESIDDAAVLRQELVQVQRVMDELNREREQERDALRAELQTLQRDGRQETIAEMEEALNEKELEIVNLTLALEAAQKQTFEEEGKNSNAEVEVLKERLEQLASLMGKSERQVETLKTENDKIVKERDALKKTLSDVQQKSDDLDSRLEALTVLCEEKDSKLLKTQEEANDLKTELFQKVQLIRDLERSKISWEERIAQCREKISKMETERLELVAQIQVGEGTTTAIQQLTEENTCLKVKLKEELEDHHKTKEAAFQGMEDMVKQLTEFQKGKRTLEVNLQSEQTKCSSLQQQLANKESLLEELKTSLARLEDENAKAEQQLSEIAAEKGVLSATINGLQLEVDNYRKDSVKLEVVMKELSDTQRNVLELQDTLRKKEEDCRHLKSKNDLLVEEISTLSDRLKSTENQLQVIGVQRASLETSLFELQKAMAEVESEKKDLEEERTGLKEMVKTQTDALTKSDEAVAILMAERVALTQELEALQQRYEEAKTHCEQLKLELTACKDAKEDVEHNLADERKRRVQLEEHVEQLSGTLESREKEFEAKQKTLQTSLDEVTGEKIALDMQLEASQAERQALLERCYASSSEAETLHTTIADLHRKLDESQAALHELGRENQTLQLDIDKLIGRKWAEDSEVYQCTLCHRDFSLIMRKHHCRNCGQIFCAECSSKTAPIASNKKPVRVCDSCYSELAPK